MPTGISLSKPVALRRRESITLVQFTRSLGLPFVGLCVTHCYSCRQSTYTTIVLCRLGCCEKLKIGIVPSNHKIKLPFNMDFNKIDKFFKNFNALDCLQGAKVTENKDFHKNG